MSGARPDIAVTTACLGDPDLRFLVENFPRPGRSYEEMARAIKSLPSTVDSMLDADYVFTKIFDHRTLLLEISPFLLFNVLLRRCLGESRTAIDRAVVHYLANLLSLFVRAERVHRPDGRDPRSYAYLVDLMAAAREADERERFLLHAHIGNYTLYLTGIFPRWLEHRRRYRRRPVALSYYVDAGRSGYQEAAASRLAARYDLDRVFLRLSLLFDHYRSRLNVVARDYLFT